ncbi:AAA family ATPase [Ornithinibacillus halophilus]|uniref:Uncharacterized protein n=1 Tax=Ornithinibacillus halophilus TaxID=930117 RepID=A0A1M5F601_9BACI|nr:hypothetical protein [Ornithinibacillus halophilus]SHF86522.1 hypothetical protein SAMN05216225_100754 [Ornithinibacillus halophilus]
MLENLNEEIIRIKGNIRRKQKIEAQLVDYENERSSIKQTISELKRRLKEEQKDVDRLTGLSITNLISTIVGSKYEKLDKEEEEVAVVQLKLEEANKTQQEIDESISSLRGKLSEVKESEKEYEQLLTKKEELIKDGSSVYSNQLYELDEREADLKAYLTELKEAETAGRYVQEALERAIDSLESAKGWGTWDIVGGGMISTAIKHDHIDKASSNIHIAQYRMRNFQKELLDVDESIKIDVDISSLLKFADFFFDDFISDWMVQGRIKDSLDQTLSGFATVKRVMDKLTNQINQQQHDLSQVQVERKKILEQV